MPDQAPYPEVDVAVTLITRGEQLLGQNHRPMSTTVRQVPGALQIHTPVTGCPQSPADQ